jgi:Ankyrin repeats (3 copies)
MLNIFQGPLDNHVCHTPRPLHEAVLKKDIEVVKFLLESGENVNQLNEDGGTLLALAVIQGSIPLTKLLLESGLDVNKKSEGQLSLLDRSINTNDLELTQLFIVNGADINHLDDRGNTPLHNAISNYRNMDVILLLIESGADINIHNDFKKTPLHLAMEKNDVKIAKLLIIEGADIDQIKDDTEAYYYCGQVIDQLKTPLVSTLKEKLTLGDFLKEKRPEYLVRYLYSETISLTLNSLKNNYSLIFPHFIKKKYREAEKHTLLPDQLKLIPFSSLPTELVEKVGYYLEVNDKKELINAILDPRKMTEDCAALTVDESSSATDRLTNDEKHYKALCQNRSDRRLAQLQRYARHMD